MSVEVIYRVLKTNGELAGEYMDKKQADAHDQKLDCIYTLVELVLEHAKDIEESVAEGIAEHLVDNKSVVLSALKKVKDTPAVKEDDNSASPIISVDDSKLETIDSNKKAANG